MVLEIGSDIFRDGGLFPASGEDNQQLLFAGSRDLYGTGTTAVELVVDAAGGGDFDNIPAALTELGSNSGVIYIKAGTYTITATLTLAANQELRGSGYGTAIITTMNDAMVESTADRCGIYNLKLLGNAAGAAQVGVNFSGEECIIRNCWVLGMGGSGIYITGNNCLIDGCYIQDCQSYCVFSAGSWTRITGCDIDNSGLHGIQLTSALGSTIVGNQISNHGENGIDVLSSYQVLISGNYIFSNGDNNTADEREGIKLAVAHDNCVVGNVLHTNNGNGIMVVGGGTPTRKAIISGNSILNNVVGAIDDNGTSTQIGHNVTG